VTIAERCLHEFEAIFNEAYFNGFADKLGLSWEAELTRPFIEKTLGLMAESRVDFTVFFQALTVFCQKGISPALPESEDWKSWLAEWQESRIESADVLARMKFSNPVLIPRNHRVEEAIQAGIKGDFTIFHRLVEALANPYEDREEFADLKLPPASSERVTATFCGT